MVDRLRAEVKVPGYVQLKVDTSRLEIAFDRGLVENASDLEKVAKKMGRFIRMGSVTSTDGYHWYCSLNFKSWGFFASDKEIAVLFPGAQDWKKVDGLRLDRPIAVMAKGKISISNAQRLVDRLSAKIDSFDPMRHFIEI